MNAELTEEEMRRALFGKPEPEEQVSAPVVQEPVPEAVFTKPAAAPAAKKKVTKAFTPRLRVKRMRPGITPCVIKPAATYAEATARFHSPAASAGA